MVRYAVIGCEPETTEVLRHSQFEVAEQTDGDLQHAMELMKQHNSLADTVNRARHFGAVARDVGDAVILATALTIAATPLMAPSASRIGAMLIETSICVPSLRKRTVS